MLRFFQSCFGADSNADETIPFANNSTQPVTPQKLALARRDSTLSEPIQTPDAKKTDPNAANFSSGSVDTIDVNNKLQTGLPDDLDDLLNDFSDGEDVEFPARLDQGSDDDDYGYFGSFNK